MKVTKKDITEFLEIHGCKNIRFLSEPKSQFGLTYYCISFTNAFDDLKITYIRGLEEDIATDALNSYTIKGFVKHHSRCEFLTFLLDDFQTNPVFNSMKLL